MQLFNPAVPQRIQHPLQRVSKCCSLLKSTESPAIAEACSALTGALYTACCSGAVGQLTGLGLAGGFSKYTETCHQPTPATCYSDHYRELQWLLEALGGRYGAVTKSGQSGNHVLVCASRFLKFAIQNGRSEIGRVQLNPLPRAHYCTFVGGLMRAPLQPLRNQWFSALGQCLTVLQRVQTLKQSLSPSLHCIVASCAAPQLPQLGGDRNSVAGAHP